MIKRGQNTSPNARPATSTAFFFFGHMHKVWNDHSDLFGYDFAYNLGMRWSCTGDRFRVIFWHSFFGAPSMLKTCTELHTDFTLSKNRNTSVEFGSNFYSLGVVIMLILPNCLWESSRMSKLRFSRLVVDGDLTKYHSIFHRPLTFSKIKLDTVNFPGNEFLSGSDSITIILTSCITFGPKMIWEELFAC